MEHHAQRNSRRSYRKEEVSLLLTSIVLFLPAYFKNCKMIQWNRVCLHNKMINDRAMLILYRKNGALFPFIYLKSIFKQQLFVLLFKPLESLQEFVSVKTCTQLFPFKGLLYKSVSELLLLQRYSNERIDTNTWFALLPELMSSLLLQIINHLLINRYNKASYSFSSFIQEHLYNTVQIILGKVDYLVWGR